MPLGDIMVHVATPIETVAIDAADASTWAEGEPDEEVDRPGDEFACCLFLPGPSQANRRGRSYKVPTLLFEEGPVIVSAMDLLVVAAEVTGPAPVRWSVEGDPQPFGPPGSVIGYLAELARVEGT